MKSSFHFHQLLPQPGRWDTEVKLSRGRCREPAEVGFWVQPSSRCLQTEPGVNETLPSAISVLEGMMMLISVQIKQ